ncbi:hypothetical protein CLV73_1960 [Chryseobacterium geocarposphaerae]|uniref:Uncharacterized protein n=1 Tax=Chryseobacterium geocarposphaerae TaxID=1416776 RepID=A0A2M9CAR4_9FLAO|nr:hypothetical protein CLV73_1960 [Chryseobacterium geocarposphaerae]
MNDEKIIRQEAQEFLENSNLLNPYTDTSKIILSIWTQPTFSLPISSS